MIDKIEVMIERGTHFRGKLDSLKLVSPYTDLSPTIRPSKFYRAVVDLRPSGFDAMLHIDQKRYRTHKVELFETGKKGMAEIQDTLERIVECDPGDCRIGRIDLCTDVRDVSLSWFREHAYVQYKQFICAHAKLAAENSEIENPELRKKSYQTLYFGKRPSCVRIYDKTAERVAHYELWKKRQVRAAKRALVKTIALQKSGKCDPLILPEFPTVHDWLSKELSEVGAASARFDSFPVVTRVENQFGGRVPELLQKLSDVRTNVLDFNPFANMRILGSGNPLDRTISGRSLFDVIDWLGSMWVHENWKSQGAQQMWSMLNRDRQGYRWLRAHPDFFPPDDGSPGVSESELYERYRSSISRQLVH